MSRRLAWASGYRIIRTIYPPVDLFEDIADPADWELLAIAEARLNPRLHDQIGNLALVPPERRVAGPTASIVMGAFTHVSTDRPSRFSDGSYGVWYCGDRVEVALAETAHHFERFMRATSEPPGDADFRLLTCPVAGRLAEAPTACLDPDDWSTGQAFGRAVRREGGDGVVYRSVRMSAGLGTGLGTGLAAALFWPDCLTLPITQARHYRYRWDGRRMSHLLANDATAWSPWPPAHAAGAADPAA